MVDKAEPVLGGHTLIADIRRRLRRHEHVEGWPDVVWLVDRETGDGRPAWQLALDGCRACGVDEKRAWPAAAVIFSLLYSIHLVDDLLDEDPDGLQHRIGAGGCANAALGLQSVATSMIRDLGLSPTSEAEAHRRLGEICLGTAYGQMLDSQDPEGEEAYWRVVDLKTPPLFSYAFFLGALVATDSVETADRVAALGGILGRIVQLNDDLKDALETPATPDWGRRATNLAILYAATADHPEREDFLRLKAGVDDPAALREAQEILIRCGAFSYCSFQMVQSYRAARRQIAALELPAHGAIVEVFDDYVSPLRHLLRSIGVEAPSEIFEEGNA
ncbi:MAG: polyprenyl synthetase family protein [Acidobacteriota bacterium]